MNEVIENVVRVIAIAIIAALSFSTPGEFERDVLFEGSGLDPTKQQALIIGTKNLKEDQVQINSPSIIDGLYPEKNVSLIYINNPEIKDFSKAYLKFGDSLIMQDNYVYEDEDGNYYILFILANKQKLDKHTQVVLESDKKVSINLEKAEGVFTNENLGEIRTYPQARETKEGFILYVSKAERIELNKEKLFKIKAQND